MQCPDDMSLHHTHDQRRVSIPPQFTRTTTSTTTSANSTSTAPALIFTFNFRSSYLDPYYRPLPWTMCFSTVATVRYLSMPQSFRPSSTQASRPSPLLFEFSLLLLHSTRGGVLTAFHHSLLFYRNQIGFRSEMNF
jgi:hypothetical protein